MEPNRLVMPSVSSSTEGDFTVSGTTVLMPGTEILNRKGRSPVMSWSGELIPPLSKYQSKTVASASCVETQLKLSMQSAPVLMDGP